MALTESAKKLQESLFGGLGDATDDIFEKAADGAAPKAITLVSEIDAEGEKLYTFRDRDATIEDRARFMNSLAALLVNIETDGVNSFSSILTRIDAVTTDIDKKIQGYLDGIVHSAEFQKLEANWGSLAELASAVNDEDVYIDFLDARYTELEQDFIDHDQDIFGSALFRKIYIEEYDRYGGKPFSAMIGLYAFAAEANDVKWLNTMGKIASAAHCPFIGSVKAAFFPPCDSMEEVAQLSDLDAVLAHPRYAAWQKLRTEPWAPYIGLTLPRYVMRQPWGRSKGESGNEIEYVETVAPDSTADESHFLWGNASVLFGRNMITSYESSGWAQHIRGPKGGGLCDGLTVYTYKHDATEREDVKPPVEIAIPDYREWQFAKNGFIPLVHKKGDGVATFFSAQSIKKAENFIEDMATKNSHLVTNLSYTFSITRIAHYVKKMMREYIGSTADGPYIQRYLSEWLNGYVTTVTNPDDLTLLYYPFKAAEVVVEPKPGPLGWYKATISILPHIQFEGMDVELRLEASLGGK